MTLRGLLRRVGAQEDLNFLLTNRLPRRLATHLMGRVSRIEQPVVRAVSTRLWRSFCDVDMSDAEPRAYASLHDAFTRALRPGARPADPAPDVLASPCDAIVGACGRVDAGRLLQIKGSPYRLADLLGGADAAAPFHDGCFATLRLTAGMYHRFHAPHDLAVEWVRYISGDTWNVNPIALKRIERLYCRNERAVIGARLTDGTPILMIAVAAILVAGIRLHFLDTVRLLRDGGPRTITGLAIAMGKGAEMGWFEHGSTMLLLAPAGHALAEGIGEGTRTRAGAALMRKIDRSQAGQAPQRQ